MRDRLLTGWNIQRVFYLLAGGAMMVISLLDKQWFGVVAGTYFASMGLFAFGCASGNCFGGTCDTESTKPSTKNEL